MANFTIKRGDTVQFSGTITQGGTALDITGASLWFTAKNQYVDDDVSAIFQKTIGDGITVVNAAQGLITILLSPSDTTGLSKVKTILVYDLQLKDTNSKIYSIASGNLVVEPDVTNSTS